METKNTISGTILKVISILAIAFGAFVLIITLTQDVMLGYGAFFDAADITYNSTDEALLAEVRNAGLIQLLVRLSSGVLMLFTGIFGIKYAKKPEKTNLCVIFAIATLVWWVADYIALTILQNIMRKYDIPGNSALPFTITIAFFMLIYVISAICNKKALKKQQSQITY